LRGSLFAPNTPVHAETGAQCSLIQTKNGHVYYWGKHWQGMAATMQPIFNDALANNMHVVKNQMADVSVGKSFCNGALNIDTWLLFVQYTCCFGMHQFFDG
jgi:hypothetical protein